MKPKPKPTTDLIKELQLACSGFLHDPQLGQLADLVRSVRRLRNRLAAKDRYGYEIEVEQNEQREFAARQVEDLAHDLEQVFQKLGKKGLGPLAGEDWRTAPDPDGSAD